MKWIKNTLMFLIVASAPAHGAESAVTFISAESSASTGTPITNRITRTVSGGIETWSMRQKQSDADGNDPEYWSHVSIVVDHSQQPAHATFFEYEPKPVVNNAPKAITPRVPCLRCHANGARAIRPSEGTMPLSAEAKRQIKIWNDSIARDGIVKPTTMAVGTFSGSDVPLELPACKSCHDDSGGVRGTLTRLHAASIIFLEQTGAMPLKTKDTHALSEAERKELKHWLSTDPRRSLRALGMTDRPAMTEGLRATVSTNLGNTITATNILATASRESWSIDLTSVTTGNVWRDKHLQRWLKEAGAEHAILKLNKIDWNSGTSSATLAWAGMTRSLTITAVCAAEHCVLKDTKISLSHFGLTPPAMLAVRVLPDISLTGTITVDRQHVTTRDHHRHVTSR